MSALRAEESRWQALERRIDQLERLITSQAMTQSPAFAEAATFAPSVFRLINEEGELRSQHYSPYWHDQEVRALIIALHRQTTIAQAVDLIAQQVGEERALVHYSGRKPPRGPMGRQRTG